MYADDGIIVTEEKIDLKTKFNTYLLKLSGVRLAIEKHFGETTKFKFLGLHYDLENRTIAYLEPRVHLKGDRK